MSHQTQGTARNQIVSTVSNPPDLGSVEYSVTGHLGFISLSTGTGGSTLQLNTGLTFGATADATYVAPGTSGLILSANAMTGSGLIYGGGVGVTEDGDFASLSGSVGYGVTMPVPGRHRLLQVFGFSRAGEDEQ